jgi:hypothetical protein
VLAAGAGVVTVVVAAGTVVVVVAATGVGATVRSVVFTEQADKATPNVRAMMIVFMKPPQGMTSNVTSTQQFPRFVRSLSRSDFDH